MAYHARIAGQRVEVESRYLAGGKLHAATTFLDGEAHGIQRVQWPNGRVQSVQYHCHGQPVGFHRYYDTAGGLVAISDHASSDYRWNRRLEGVYTILTPTEAGRFTIATTKLSGPIRIRKLYEVRGNVLSKGMLQSPGIGTDPYSNSDVRLEQIVTGGDQGFITLNGKRVRLINAPMDYTPFWELYERDRQGNPGADPFTEENQKLLACPWMDEAMKPPLRHPALARPKVSPLTEAERQATHRVRYLACLQQPSEACLMPLALPLALNGSHRDTFLKGTVVAALEMRQTGLANEAIAALQANEPAYSSPNPYLALTQLLSAQEALRAGDAARAEIHAKASLRHAQHVPQSHEMQLTLRTLRRLGPELARLGFADLAMRAHQQLKTADDPGAIDVLGAAGLAYARADQMDAASAAATQLRQSPEWPLPEHQREQGPVSWYSPRVAHVHALARIAQALSQRGNAAQAREVVAQAEAELARISAPSRWDISKGLQALAVAHASLGNSERADQLTNQMHAFDRPLVQQELAAAPCDAGNPVASEKLESLRAALPTNVSGDSPALYARAASSHIRCGQVREGRALFEQAIRHADKAPLCWRGVCGAPQRYAREAVALELLKFDQLDILASWNPGHLPGPSVTILWAERLAASGDRPAARERLAGLIGEGKSVPEPFRIDVLLAQARIEGSASRPDASLMAASSAAAWAIDDPQQRAAALLSIARAFNAAGEQAQARPLLQAARAGFDDVLGSSQSQAGIAYTESSTQLGMVAGEFVVAGSLEEALKTAQSLYLQPGSLAAQYRAQGFAESIDAVIFMHTAASMEPQVALAAFEALPASGLKAFALNGWLQAPGKPPAASTLQAPALDPWPSIDAYFASASSSLDRRTLLGLFSGWLRADPQKPEQAKRLEQLATHARRTADVGWRARSLCELGFTGISLGLAAGRPLLQEGSTLSAQFDGRKFPLDPTPAGACAYWSRKAGESEMAADLVARAVEPLRAAVRYKPDGNYPTSATDLLNASVALFEAERGELAVEWNRNYWRN